MSNLRPHLLLCTEARSRVFWLICVCAPWQPFVAAETFAVESRCPGRASPPQIVTQEPRLVAEDPFGKRFQVDLSNQDSIPLLHVYGSPYELGRAHDMLARRLARLMVNFALDLTYLLTWIFTPSRYVDEMVGLADGANVNYRDVVRIQMFPELSKASCSMLGSWGPATFDTSKAGSLYQLRALDWDMTSPIIGFHTIIFFHPADGNQFAIFTWSGFIGCITGYSGMLGVSEKVWLGSGHLYSRVGMPWHFVLRDVLQFTKNIENAKTFLESVKRTCPLFVGIGSLLENKFVLLGYSLETVELYDDSNFTLVTLEKLEHGPPGVVFVDKYVQPSNDPCMEDLVKNSYGILNGTTLLKTVSVLQSGDMHIAVYDFSANVVYFSWAIMNQMTKTIQPAYNRYTPKSKLVIAHKKF